MKFKFDHDLHIHSHLSLCSNEPTQTPENLLKYAEEAGLKKICITNHFWDETVSGASDWYKKQNFEHISEDCPLPKSDKVEICFGCETELDKYFTLGLSSLNYDKFDFIIIPTTHLHMSGFTIFDEDVDSLERRAALWCDRLETVLNIDLPFYKVGIAHLTCNHMANGRGRVNVLKLIPEDRMRYLFSKAARLGVGIELNFGDMRFSDDEADIVLKPFRIAKESGCKFYCGSDSHRFPDGIEFRKVFERAIDMLDLREEDKINFLKS